MGNTATRLHIKDSIEKIAYTDDLAQIADLIQLLRHRKDFVKNIKHLSAEQLENAPEYLGHINQKIKNILYL